MTATGVSVQGQNERENQSQNQEQNRQGKEEMKGSYLTISAGVGSSSFNYKLNSLGEKGTSKAQLGYGIDIKYSYFFTTHWGITSGVGLSHYATKGKFQGGITDGNYYKLGMQTDNDLEGRPRDFELRARVSNLEEKQMAYFLEIPLMLSYHTYFKEQNRCWGFYGGLGAKLQLPVSSKFKIQNGSKSEFNVSGDYEGIPTDMGAPSNPPVPQHGYGTIMDPNSSLGWDDKAKLKIGVAATAELGVIFSLGKTTDLQVGGYLDYGITDMKKNGNQGLFSPVGAYHPGADNKIGNGIKYNGMMSSDVTGKIRLISCGVKIGVKFKMNGKENNSHN